MNLKFLLTRSLYEKPNLSQRTLAKIFKLSLGKINQNLKLCEDDGLLTKTDGTYKVTEKAISEIKKHKVDSAVIFACGMGLRLAPLTYDTPKSFLKIKGERMIERQIEQLKSAGINDITIMVGYLKEHFEYLIDKYDVKLVYNPEYKTKNTLSTFYHAIDIIKNKNVYICVSDVYMEDNLYHEYEIEPYYIGAYRKDCKNEWRYDHNSKNEIKGFILGGENDYILVGPCFLTKEYLNELIPLIKKYYAMSHTSNYYWENVLEENFKTLPTMYVYKVSEETIHEFDSLSDISDYDKTLESFGSKAISFVSEALNCKETDIKNIELIKEGLTNKSYKFDFGGVTYIARIPGIGTSEYIDRVSEHDIYMKLKDSSITEKVIYYEKTTGYKISEYLRNARIIDMNNDNELKTAMTLYQKFHSLDIKVGASCDIIEKNKENEKTIKDRKIDIPFEDYKIIKKDIDKIEECVHKFKRPRTLTHGDANPGNILFTDMGIKLIDFEYAGMSDPISDIALLSVYMHYDITKCMKLYKYYKEADPHNKFLPKNDDEAKVLLIYYMTLGSLWNVYWAIVMAATTGNDYGMYAMEHYQDMKKDIEYIKKEVWKI